MKKVTFDEISKLGKGMPFYVYEEGKLNRYKFATEFKNWLGKYDVIIGIEHVGNPKSKCFYSSDSNDFYLGEYNQTIATTIIIQSLLEEIKQIKEKVRLL